MRPGYQTINHKRKSCQDAYPGDLFYADFIGGEDAELAEDTFPGGGPTALAEFFGDHILVNGKIWPKASVESRQYLVIFLNGSDSRFMRLRLKVIENGASNPEAMDRSAGALVPFLIIGSDQSLRATAEEITEVDFLPGERLDLIIDFKDVPYGSWVIVENILGGVPYGGHFPDPDDLFENRLTDRVMAFDVEVPFDAARSDTTIIDGSALGGGVSVAATNTVRKLALFERGGRVWPFAAPAGSRRADDRDQR